MHLQSNLRKCGIGRDERVISGVSGGADSLFLLYHLKESGQPVTAAIFDHRLRPESASEVEFVRKLCREWEIPLVTGSGDVSGLAEAEKLTMEEAGRMLRYRFLFDTAQSGRAAAVCTAHHADDQAETILMHFLRGSGLDGLKGMQMRTILPVWDAEIPLVRPILDVTRAEIEAWCAKMGISPVRDASNLDNQYLRNRIRNVLLPELKAHYNPEISSNILKMSATLNADYEIISECTEKAWQDCAAGCQSGDDFRIFRRAVFGGLSAGIQTRLIRRAAFEMIPGLRDLNFDKAYEALDFFREARENDAHFWLDQLSLAAEGDRMVIFRTGKRPNFRHYPQLEAGSFGAAPGTSVSGEKYRMTCSAVTELSENRAEVLKQMKESRMSAFLDADQLKFPLEVRRTEAGERFLPVGAGGSQKISDFWINHKVPEIWRKNYPVVFSAGAAVWIPGFACADACRIREETGRFVILKWEENEAAFSESGAEGREGLTGQNQDDDDHGGSQAA